MSELTLELEQAALGGDWISSGSCSRAFAERWMERIAELERYKAALEWFLGGASEAKDWLERVEAEKGQQ